MSNLSRSNIPKSHSLFEPPSMDLIKSSEQFGENPSLKRKHGTAISIILGLAVLQVITLVTALTIVRPNDARPTDTAALDVPLPVETYPATKLPSPASQPPVTAVESHAEPIVPATPLPTPAPPEVIPNNHAELAIQAEMIVTTPTEAAKEPAQPAALKIRGMELTQGIQVLQEPENPRCHPNADHPSHIFCNNSVPMVAGRHTMLRIYLACVDDCPTTDTVLHLRLLKEGQEQDKLTAQMTPDLLEQVDRLSLPELRANLDHSVNFEFRPPPAWMEGDITFELTALPENERIKAPAEASLSKMFVKRRPLRVAYVPIQYRGYTPTDLEDADYWLLRMYPVPAVEYYRLPVQNLVWIDDLSKEGMLRKLLEAYSLSAESQTDTPQPDQLFGWLSPEVYNGGSSDPFWCPNCAGPRSSRVAFGGLRPERDIGGPRILVHEIAHNLGAQHAWTPSSDEDANCFRVEDKDIRVDPAWPYAEMPTIQEFGIDLYSNPPIIYPPSTYDMMAYCTQSWISPYTYRTLFDSSLLRPDQTDPNFFAISPSNGPTESFTFDLPSSLNADRSWLFPVDPTNDAE